MPIEIGSPSILLTSKTKAVILNKPNTITRSNLHWELGDKTVCPSEETTQLAIIRIELKEHQLNVEARMSLARRTLYSLIINTGVYDSNRLIPKVSFKIYQCYVLPRLLYGLEILPLSKTHLDILNKFHMKTLRNFQSLPSRTAKGATFPLIGALPLEAEIHRRQLSFLHNILACNNTTIRDLAELVLIDIDNPLSFFCITSQLLHQYELPDINTLAKNQPKKISWKHTVREAVRKHWLKILPEDIENKSTLVNLQKDLLKFGSTHQVWDSLQSTVSDVKKGIIKARLLTGTCMLQAMRSKYSTGKESTICKCCGIENEDITHFLLSCPALFQKRKLYYSQLKESVINMIAIDKWNIQFSSKLDIVKLIID
jgi:hypothetical protein